MKNIWLFLPAVAGCLSLDQPGHSFVNSCRDLRVSPDDGILSGNCDTGDRDGSVDTSVELDGCLAWGDAGGTAARLYPAKGGNFTDRCTSCSLIQPGQSPNQVGFILCKCGPEGSDVKLEYTLDLDEIMSIGNDGRLQCLADKDAVPAIPILNGNHAVVNTISDAVDWRAWLDKVGNSTNTCVEDVRVPRREWLLPMQHGNEGFEPCPNDISLCCYYAPEDEGYARQGFKLIEVPDYWYRLHFKANLREAQERYIHMSMVFRFCKDVDRCPDGQTPPAWDVPESAMPDPARASTKSKSRRRKTKTATTSTTTRRVIIQAQDTVPPKMITIIPAPTSPEVNSRTLMRTVATSSTSTSTDSHNYDGANTAVVEVKVVRALLTPITTLLVNEFPKINLSTSLSQKLVTVRGPLPSPEPEEHLIRDDRLDTETLKRIVIDAASPSSDITVTRDFNVTLAAALLCPSESDYDCDMAYELVTYPPSHMISMDKFDVSALATLMFDTIINKEDPHVGLLLISRLECFAASKSCVMAHTLNALPEETLDISLPTSQATSDGLGIVH